MFGEDDLVGGSKKRGAEIDTDAGHDFFRMGSSLGSKDESLQAEMEGGYTAVTTEQVCWWLLRPRHDRVRRFGMGWQVSATRNPKFGGRARTAQFHAPLDQGPPACIPLDLMLTNQRQTSDNTPRWRRS